MSMFSFSTANKIVFGRHRSIEVASHVARLADTVLLVTGATKERAAHVYDELEAQGVEPIWFHVEYEPDLALIEKGVSAAQHVDAVIAVGGGSAIDTGKAIAALAPGTRPALDHLEVVGRGLSLEFEPLPFFALPTTSGTGAEVTKNAVITVPEHRRKVSLRDPRMLPDLAVVDPALTDGCPPDVTLASGLDAVTQVIEPFLSTRANRFTDALCRDAIPLGLSALVRLMEKESPEARDDLSWSSLCGGLALANSGLGAVHGLAGPFGGLTGAPHGAVCGALLPSVLIANARAGAGRRVEQVALWISHALSMKETSDIEIAAQALKDWCEAAGLPGLRQLGGTDDVFREAANQAGQSSSMKANPVHLSPDDLFSVLCDAG